MSEPFSALLDRLGHRPDDTITVCHRPPGGVFGWEWTTAAEAPKVADRFAATEDVWFSINRTRPCVNGRGSADDVTRVAAFPADLDVKPGGMPTMRSAIRVICDVAVILGTKPVAVVDSGHGLHPYWAVDVDDPAATLDNESRSTVTALLRRFGDLMHHVAARHGGAVDSVYDLARILRVPGTWNRKRALVPVRLMPAEGRPLRLAEIEEALTAFFAAIDEPDPRDVGAVTAEEPSGVTATCPPAEVWDGTPPDQRQAAYLDVMLDQQADRVATTEPGGRNNAVYEAGMACGNFIAGAGMDELTVERVLLDAAARCGLVAEDGGPAVLKSIRSGIENGKQRPRAVPTEADTEFERAVKARVFRLKVAEAAQEHLHSEKAANDQLVDVKRLGDFLAIPDEGVPYRVTDLWPTGGRVVLCAPHKAGKTTAVGNLVRSLVDGTPFLDAFDVAPARRVVIIDNELDPRMLRRWLADHDIVHVDRVDVLAMRGRLSSFNILDPRTRTRWATHIGKADVLVLDCLRPGLDALGLSEDKDAGRFLEALDELTTEAGIAETLVVHHMGHQGERSRGDSRIQDWPDALWKLVKKSKDDSTRDVCFSAYGRDVDHGETLLSYDHGTRRLSVAGGSWRDCMADHAAEAVIEILASAQGPLSGRAIEQRLKNSEHTQQAVRDALQRVVATGRVMKQRRSGRGGGFEYSLSASTAWTAAEVDYALGEKCVSASI